MLDGYVDFFLDPNLADCYLKLKEELDKLIQKKVSSYLFTCNDIPCLLITYTRHCSMMLALTILMEVFFYY